MTRFGRRSEETPMPEQYPLPSSNLESARLRREAARTSRPADPRAYRTGPLSRRADRAGAQRPARAVPHLWRRQDRGRPRGGVRRHAVPAVQPDQGADQRGGMDAGRGGPAVVHGQGQRPPAGIRRARQRRYHPAPGHDAPGRLPVAAMSAAKAGPIMPGCAPRSATSRSTGPPARGCNTTRAPPI